MKTKKTQADYYPAKQIAPHVWVGSEYDAGNPAFWKRHDIRLIVNCTKDIPFSSKTIKGYRVPVDDAGDSAETMARYLPISSIVIHDVVRYGHNVLVHCYAGMNRSATVAAGYLMFSKGMSAQEAMAAIKSKKTECFSPMNFGSSLASWESKLRTTGHVPGGLKNRRNVRNQNQVRGLVDSKLPMTRVR